MKRSAAICAGVEQRIGVVEAAVLDPGQPDEHRRAAVGGLARERLAGLAADILEGRLQDEILGRIAGEEELGEHDHVGAEPGRLGARLAHLGGVAGDVADGRVELRERDPEGFRGGHGRGVARRPEAGNGAARSSAMFKLDHGTGRGGVRCSADELEVSP